MTSRFIQLLMAASTFLSMGSCKRNSEESLTQQGSSQASRGFKSLTITPTDFGFFGVLENGDQVSLESCNFSKYFKKSPATPTQMNREFSPITSPSSADHEGNKVYECPDYFKADQAALVKFFLDQDVNVINTRELVSGYNYANSNGDYDNGSYDTANSVPEVDVHFQRFAPPRP